MLGSIWPMLSVPHVPGEVAAERVSSRVRFYETFADPVYRRVVVFQWGLAFWSGLTQVAFFEYRYQTLKIGLGTFALMETAMRLLQIPVNRWSGRAVEQRGIRPVLTLGIGMISSGLLFWIVADSKEWWWLWGAYVLWGGWGCVNVAGPLLTLKHAPASDNTMQISVAERGAGMLAGVAGLVGGFLLIRLQNSTVIEGMSAGFPYRVMFGMSLVGRLLSLVWLWRIPREPQLEMSPNSASQVG